MAAVEPPDAVVVARAAEPAIARETAEAHGTGAQDAAQADGAAEGLARDTAAWPPSAAMSAADTRTPGLAGRTMTVAVRVQAGAVESVPQALDEMAKVIVAGILAGTPSAGQNIVSIGHRQRVGREGDIERSEQ